jgi:hypothetical protein
MYSDDNRNVFEERNLKTMMENLSRHLSQHTWSGGLTTLDALRQFSLRARGARDDLIFLISDFSPISASENDATAQEWRSVLRRLSGDFVPVIISFHLPREVIGTVKLWDPERQSQHMTYLTPSRIDKINEKEMKRVLKLESFFRSLGLDYLIMRHERDVYPQLAKLTGLRRRRKS